MLQKMIYILLLCFLFSENKLPNDVRWVVHSHEYKSLCHQIYNHATFQLDQYNDMKESKKLAVIMDLDETVLDNSEYQVELFLTHTEYNPKSWNKWVKKEEANSETINKQGKTERKNI